MIQETSFGIHYHQGYAGLPAANIEDLVSDLAALKLRNGSLPVPTGPGLGLSLDPETVRARACDWVLPPSGWRNADGTVAEW